MDSAIDIAITVVFLLGVDPVMCRLEVDADLNPSPQLLVGTFLSFDPGSTSGDQYASHTGNRGVLWAISLRVTWNSPSSEPRYRATANDPRVVVFADFFCLFLAVRWPDRVLDTWTWL